MTRLLNSSPVRLGIVPLSDCAPMAVAMETGIFQRMGLHVKLTKELGWASVRDKIFYGQLDAAQSISGIAMALGLGIDNLRCEVAVPMILSLHGNAITLSMELGPEKMGTGGGLKTYLRHYWKKSRPLTLAVPHRHSSHHILLHGWLTRHGVVPGQDVEIIFLPPPIMPDHLRAGLIDGFCVGEPWNSQSILEGCGWVTATSADLSLGHPEKVLTVSGRFLAEHRDKTVALVAALIEACELCQNPEFSEELIAILSRDAYIGAAPDVIRNGFSGAFQTGAGTVYTRPFHLFYGDDVNRPTADKASWQLSGLRMIGALDKPSAHATTSIHREDIYERALQRINEGVS